jgi:hypothetical protein
LWSVAGWHKACDPESDATALGALTRRQSLFSIIEEMTNVD